MILNYGLAKHRNEFRGDAFGQNFSNGLYVTLRLKSSRSLKSSRWPKITTKRVVTKNTNNVHIFTPKDLKFN
jgi:hypothetical protein